MVWIFLAASEESVLHFENGLNLSPIVKSIPIVKQCSYPEWPIEDWQKLRYGMILQLFQGIPLEKKKSILSMADSHARISVLQDLEKAWQESEADYFLRLCAWPKKSSPNSYSLKTCQQSQQEEDFKSLKKLPRWGMIVAGVLY